MSYRNPVRAVGVVGTVTTVSSGGGTTGPTYRSSSRASGNGVATVSAPSGLQVGDLMIASLGTNNNFSPACPSDWTMQNVIQSPYNSTMWFGVASKIATAADVGGSYSFGPGTQYGTSSDAIIEAWSGVKNVYANPANGQTGGSGLISAAVNTKVGQLAHVLCHSAGGAAAGDVTWSAPSAGPPTAPTVNKTFSVGNNALLTGTSAATWAAATSYTINGKMNTNVTATFAVWG